MVKKKIGSTILLLIVFLIVGCFAAPVWGAEIVWRLGGGTAIGTPETLSTNYFVKLVEERTDGRMKIDFYPAAQLGASDEQFDNLKLGAQDASVDKYAKLRDLNADFNIFSVPYLFSDVDHIKRFFATDTFQQMEKEILENSGIRVIAKNWWCEPRVLLLAKPASSLEDIKGRLLRMANSMPYIKTWEALGAVCIEIAWGEAYSAVDTGVVDGVDSPIDTIYGMGFHKVAPYILMTNHIQGIPNAVFVSEKSWQALPQDIKTIVEVAANEAGDYYYDLIHASHAENMEKIKNEGGKFIEVDISPALKVMGGVVSDLEEANFIPKGLYNYVDGLR